MLPRCWETDFPLTSYHEKKQGKKISVLIWTFDCHHVLRKINFHGTFAGAPSSIFCSNSLYKVHGWYKVPIWTRVNVFFIFHLYLKNGVKTKGHPETVPDALHCRWYGNAPFYLVTLQRTLFIFNPIYGINVFHNVRCCPLIFADSFVRECVHHVWFPLLVQFLWRFYVIFTQAWLWVFCQYYYNFEVLIWFLFLFIEFALIEA